MQQFANLADLVAGVLATMQPSPEEVVPPEWATIRQQLLALPEGKYALIDPEEGHHTPLWLDVLPATALAEWDGSAEGSWGYGGVNSLASNGKGTGLYVWLAGSPAQSASGFYVLPAALAWYVGEEE